MKDKNFYPQRNFFAEEEYSIHIPHSTSNKKDDYENSANARRRWTMRNK